MALICNITVVTSSVFLMHKGGLLKSKRIWPLVILSIPMAYLGGRFRMQEETFFLILGITLLVASLVMLFVQNKTLDSDIKKLSKYSNGFIGGGIGLLSGVVGIGGGIFLSPILHFTKWGKVKEIAATTALFILFNSIAGLIGQISTYGWNLTPSKIVLPIIAVLLGGQVGVRMTLGYFQPLMVKRITGVLILIVALRLLFFR